MADLNNTFASGQASIGVPVIVTPSSSTSLASGANVTLSASSQDGYAFNTATNAYDIVGTAFQDASQGQFQVLGATGAFTDFVTGLAQSLQVNGSSATVGLLTGGNTYNAITNSSGVYAINAAGSNVTVVNANMANVFGSGGSLDFQTNGGATTTITDNAGDASATISDPYGGSTIVLWAGSGSTLTTNNDTLVVAPGLFALETGNNNSISLGSASILGLVGAGDIVSGTGAKIAIDGSSNITVTSNGTTINIWATQSGVTSNNDTLYVASGETAYETGNGNAIILGSGAILGVSGSGDTIYGTSATVSVNGTSSAVTVTSAGTSITVWGDDSSVSVNNDTLTIAGGITAFTTGNGDSIFIGSATMLGYIGVGDTISGPGGTISVNGASSNLTVTTTGVEVDFWAGGAYALLNGDTALVTKGLKDAVQGNNDTFTVSSTSTLVFDGGSGDSVSGPGAYISVNAASSGLTVTSGGVSLGLWATGDNITATGDSVYLSGGLSAAVTGTTNAISCGNGATLAVSGTGNTVFEQGSTLTVSGSGATLELPTGATLTATGTNFNVQLASGSGANTSVLVNDPANNTSQSYAFDISSAIKEQMTTYTGLNKGGYASSVTTTIKDGTVQTVNLTSAGAVSSVVTQYTDGSRSVLTYGSPGVGGSTATTNNYSATGQLIESTYAAIGAGFQGALNGYYHTVTYFDYNNSHTWSSISKTYNGERGQSTNGLAPNQLQSFTITNHDGSSLSAYMLDPYYLQATFSDRSGGSTAVFNISSGHLALVSGSLTNAGDLNALNGDFPALNFLGSTEGWNLFQSGSMVPQFTDSASYYFNSVIGAAYQTDPQALQQLISALDQQIAPFQDWAQSLVGYDVSTGDTTIDGQTTVFSIQTTQPYDFSNGGITGELPFGHNGGFFGF